MSVQRIKKDDLVVVVSGAERTKTGKVLQILPGGKRALVEGLNLVKKSQKKTDNQAGGIVEKEAPIHVSNLMLFDPAAKKGVRVGVQADGDTKVRKSKASNHTF